MLYLLSVGLSYHGCRAVALRQPPKPFFVVATAMVPEPVEGRCDSPTNPLFLPFLRSRESNIEAETVERFWFGLSRLNISIFMVEIVVAQLVEYATIF